MNPSASSLRCENRDAEKLACGVDAMPEKRGVMFVALVEKTNV